MNAMLPWQRSRPDPDDAPPPVAVRSVDDLDRELAADEDDLPAAPFTADLGPNDLYLLARLGYEPVQVVFGTIVYSMGLRGVMRTLLRAFTRGEMADFSHLQRVARQLAIARCRERARAIGAAGVVSIGIQSIQYADFLEVIATGTAVRRLAAQAGPGPEIVVAS
jgi:uncharacterized protein YbjQ (UPF0145 family)